MASISHLALNHTLLLPLYWWWMGLQRTRRKHSLTTPEIPKLKGDSFSSSRSSLEYKKKHLLHTSLARWRRSIASSTPRSLVGAARSPPPHLTRSLASLNRLFHTSLARWRRSIASSTPLVGSARWVNSTHKKAKGLFGVPFPHYETLAEIYGKDREIGAATESFVQAVQNIDDDLARGSVTFDSDDDLDFDVEAQAEAQSESLQSASGSRERKDPPFVKSAKKTRIRLKKSDDVGDLTTSLKSASAEIGKVFENMNADLGVMAQMWSSEEERKKNLENDSNIILEEGMKLDISPSDALEVATILMVEEPKLRVFLSSNYGVEEIVCQGFVEEEVIRVC